MRDGPADAGVATTGLCTSLANAAAAHADTVLHADTLFCPDGGLRPAADSSSVRRTKIGMIGLVVAASRLRSDAESRSRESVTGPSRPVPLDGLPLVSPSVENNGGEPVGVAPTPAVQASSAVPASSFGGDRLLLDLLPRISAQQIAVGSARPTDGDRLRIEVELQVEADRRVRCSVELTTYRTGFGFARIALCPSCGRRVRLLYAHPDHDRLVCSKCSGATRLSIRHGHAAWFRHALRHVRRAANLYAAASRPRIRMATRERLAHEAAQEVEAAIAGMVRLGVLPGHVAEFRDLLAAKAPAPPAVLAPVATGVHRLVQTAEP